MYKAGSIQLQRGSTLFIALTFLVVITLMALSGMQTATLQERMAGGERDYNIALQAAEMALRDAEHDLLGVDYQNNPIPGKNDGGATCNAGSIGRACFERIRHGQAKLSRPLSVAHELWTHWCQWGQCYISTNTDAMSPTITPLWTNQALWEASAKTAAGNVPSSVTYGSFTGAPALDIPDQPQYILEALNLTLTSNTPVSATGTVLSYRITARGVGLNPQTVVLLQEVFQCSSC